MEGVLEAAVLLCVCKVSCSSLMFLPAVTCSVSAVSLCCMCLLLFTDFAVTLFLFFMWISESWFMPFQVSSDVIALRFLVFLSQVYGVVLMFTPPLITVEHLVILLRSQEKTEHDENTNLSRTMAFLSCLLVWILSGIYSSNSWRLGQISTETCLDKGSSLINCLPSFIESPSPLSLFWILPAMVLLLTLTVKLGNLETRSPENTLTQLGGRNRQVAPTQAKQATLEETANLFQTSGTQSEKKPDSCAVYRAGFVYNEEGWVSLGNVSMRFYQTGLAESFFQRQKLSTGHAPFLVSTTQPLLEMKSPEDGETEHCDYKRTEPVVTETLECQRQQSEWENPCLGKELFRGLLCAVLVCVFPTVVSGNILLILNLETLVVHTVKLLSL